MKSVLRRTIFSYVLTGVALAGWAGQAAAQSAAASPLGRWITASGNLEVEIAPCGNALCGTVTKVLANRSMSRDGEEMHPVDTRPALGMQLLKGFVPTKTAESGSAGSTPVPIEWAGEIYNRENGKTYSCNMSIGADGKPGQLVLRPYVGIPLFGKTQIWQRSTGEPAKADVKPDAKPEAKAAPNKTEAGKAPEFSGVDRWFNSTPLSMNSLRGKVVLIDFWTHTCGNCLNTLPHVEALHQRYKDRGLVVVGVHTPETAEERDPERVRSAIQRFGINYPVAQDNQYRTWTAWQNQYWPAVYLVDKQGKVVFKHYGEGDYALIEQQVQKALQ